MSVLRPAPFVLRDARPTDHAALVKLAKTSPYTSDFSNRIMFSSDAAYGKGWIRMMYQDPASPLGFYCVRHKSRGEKETVLYFITVHPDWRSKGIGESLIEDLKRRAPAGIIHLNVAKANSRARAFYESHGFNAIDESLGGEAWRMEWRKIS